MRPMRAAIPALLLAAIAAPANAERVPTRYFDLVNASHDSVTSLAVAPAGSGAFRDIDLGAPLRGGLTSTTVRIPDDGCRHDFRVVFRDGRTLVYRDIDVCRYRQLRLTARDGSRADREKDTRAVHVDTDDCGSSAGEGRRSTACDPEDAKPNN